MNITVWKKLLDTFDLTRFAEYLLKYFINLSNSVMKKRFVFIFSKKGLVPMSVTKNNNKLNRKNIICD